MPLINLNKKEEQKQDDSAPSLNPGNNTQTNTLGENMPLRENINVTTQNGVKEYTRTEVQQPMQTPPIQNVDPSMNLDQKIQNIVPVQKPEPLPPVPKPQPNPIQQTPAPVNFNNNLLPEIPQNTLVQQQLQVPVQPQQQTDLSQISTATMSFIEIVERTISEEASDIHLTVGYRPIIRVDGELKTLNAKELTAEEMVKHCSIVIENRKDIKIEEIKQVDLSYTYKDRRFRVNIFKMMGTLSLVARLIPKTIKSIDELELPQITKELAKVPSGLVLLTGPTGSGKSTTLAAILNHINLTRAEHIVTLEDPIEFVFPKGQSLIDQREMGQDFDTWPNALRAILRQDPNVVLVGEMRDFETIASTITVSETGHLVFATLHTNSAAQTIDRIIDVFPENQQEQIRTQLAQVLTAVVAQRLVPLPGGGRKAVHEILVATPAVKNAIREGQTHQIDNMIQTGQDYGMMTMEKSLVDLIKKGLISIETAKEVSIKPDELDILLSQV